MPMESLKEMLTFEHPTDTKLDKFMLAALRLSKNALVISRHAKVTDNEIVN